MRIARSLALTMLALAAAAAPVALAAAPAPRTFVATYEVTYRGLRAGSLTFELKHDASKGRYLFETHADPSLLARLIVSSAANERSVMEIGSEGVRPIKWRLDDGKSGDQKDGMLEFDWTRRVVSGTIEGEQLELPTEPNMQDRLSIQISVSAALLRGEEPGEIPLIDDNRVKRYTYTRKDAETLDTKLGKVDAVVFESTRAGSSRVSRMWLAPEFDFTPVRAEQIRKGKVETVMVLTGFEMTEKR